MAKVLSYEEIIEILKQFEEQGVNLAYPTRLLMKDTEQTWKI